MEEVTDTVFRQIISRIGRPEVFFTEFTNVEGLCSDGQDEVSKRLKFTEGERPIVAQVWGMKPENYLRSAKMISEMGFDGIDINMGCPQKEVVKNGAGIALVNNRSLVREIVEATRKGAGGLPVSVKTRIGLNKIVTEDWCGFLLGLGLDALTVHGRTAKEKSDVPAHWDEIAKVVKIRDYMKRNLPVAEAPGSFHIPRVDTLVIGNGDVRSRKDGGKKAEEFGVDGVMVGRGALENPWCFSDYQPTKEERLKMLAEHVKLWEKTWGNTRNFAIMKKFVKAYVRNWEGAAELRARLFETNSAEEMEEALRRKRDSNPHVLADPSFQDW